MSSGETEVWPRAQQVYGAQERDLLWEPNLKEEELVRKRSEGIESKLWVAVIRRQGLVPGGHCGRQVY